MALALGTRNLDTIEPVLIRPRIVTADSLEAVDRLEPGWRELDAETSSPLTQFSWMRAALAAFSADGTPRVIAVARGDRLVALAPLVKRRLHGVRRLFLAGVSQISEPSDLLWTDETSLARLTAAVSHSGSPVFIERIAADSPALEQLRRSYWGRAVIITRPQAPCPYIALDESWLTPERHLNSGRRSDLRRARRKAEQLGPVTTEIHAPGLHELPQLVDTAFEVEARSWKGQAGTALARDAVRAVFYRQFAQAACTAGFLRICFLRIGDRVAAMQMAIEQNGGFWLLKVGYDARFAQCSPGSLLMRDTIRYAVEAGLERYEFLGQAESWTDVWTKNQHTYVSLRVYPLCLRGMAALAADLGAAALARWRRE